MDERTEAFWQDYLRTLAPEHPHRRVRPEAYAFGDSPRLADELAELIRIGRKRATTSLPAEIAIEGQKPPAVGDVSIVLRSDGTPVAVIETVGVREMPFHAVDEAFAAEEGEGDGTLVWWQKAHRRYFGRVAARLGAGFDETTMVICERFRLVWAADSVSVR